MIAQKRWNYVVFFKQFLGVKRDTRGLADPHAYTNNTEGHCCVWVCERGILDYVQLHCVNNCLTESLGLLPEDEDHKNPHIIIVMSEHGRCLQDHSQNIFKASEFLRCNCSVDCIFLLKASKEISVILTYLVNILYIIFLI